MDFLQDRLFEFTRQPVRMVDGIYDFLGESQDDYVRNYEEIHKDHRSKPESLETSIFRNICELLIPKICPVRVLDLGCGRADLLRNIDCQLKVGLDISLEALKDTSPSVIRVRADAEDIPFVSGFFDAILCLDLIEHVRNLLSVMSEIGRILRAGGTLLLACPWEQKLSVYSSEEYKKEFNKYEYVHLRSINDIVIKIHFTEFKEANSTMITAAMRYMKFDPYSIKFMEFVKG